MIKFCAKLKQTVAEMKEMLDAANNESAISPTSVYRWHQFKSGRKNAELMGGHGALITTLTKQSTLAPR